MISFIKRCVEPKMIEEDNRRQEFILNVLLVSAVFLLISAILSSGVTLFFISDAASRQNNAFSFGVLFGILSFFIFLYILSRKGFFRLASYLLLGTFFLLAVYMSYRWGVEIQVALLFYVMIIVMSGVLIRARFAFFVTIISFVVLEIINYFQNNNFIQPNRYWITESWKSTDVFVTSILFAIIATVSWLSNREIEKSLVRARKSEAELKKERDLLEIKVEERTKELKETQTEKMTQMYRFAEFGRLSSGLFHDLINPLNAVSLNMEKVRSQNGNGNAVAETKVYLDEAIQASKKMENFVSTVRKQIVKQGDMILFSLEEEIKQVIDMLSHKALKADVKIVFSSLSNNGVQTFGDAIRFNQVVLNLIANAIDAYDNVSVPENKDRKVLVSLREENNIIILSVEDFGAGILEENMSKIFEPFFTTKGGNGIGIGLSMVKRIVEKDFNGGLVVKSKAGQGATFTIKFPKIKSYE